MKKMKWMLGISAVTLALSGCGGTGSVQAPESSISGSESVDTTTSQADGNQVTLRFAWWGGDSRCRFRFIGVRISLEPV